MDVLEYDVADSVAVIRLNRPQVRNAMNLALGQNLLEAVELANANRDVRAVIIEGAGESFCAGADLNDEFPADFDASANIDKYLKPTLLGIMDSEKPYIAALNGAAVGVGCGLALACDKIVMADDGYMLFAFANIGLAPDGGTSWYLLHLLGAKRAFEMLTCGERISAQTCLGLGLVNHITASGELAAESRRAAAKLIGKPRMGIACAKHALSAARHMDIGEAISFEGKLQNDATQSPEFQAALKAFAARR